MAGHVMPSHTQTEMNLVAAEVHMMHVMFLYIP